MRTHETLLVLLLLCAGLVIHPAGSKVSAASYMDNFIDPKDGNFDVSDWLKQRGFLPIAEVVTEPAGSASAI